MQDLMKLVAGIVLLNRRVTYHSRSLYMMVKKTCRNRLTALINTANRNSHASPDILSNLQWPESEMEEFEGSYG